MGLQEAEWRLLIRQQSDKLLQSLRETAEEHLREQELLVGELLAKAKDDFGPPRQRELCESTSSPQLHPAPKELVTVAELPSSSEDAATVCVSHGATLGGCERLHSYLDTEMNDLTAGIMSKAGDLDLAPEPTYVQRFLAFTRALEEPPRTGGRLASIVMSNQFEISTLIVITVYSLFAIWMTNKLLNEPEILKSWGVLWAETCFMMFFVWELAAKLFVHRFYFFCNDDMGWNWLDFFIIIFSLVDFALNVFNSDAPTLQDVNYVRVLRALRISKSLRILRAVRFVSELRVLMMCIIGSFSVLFWCVMLLMLIQAGVSTALVQLVAEYVNEERRRGVEEVELTSLIDSFGTVQASMLRLFQSTTGGIDWGSVLALVGRAGWVATLIYGLYLLFFFVAAWNIITSMFIEKAMKLAQPDFETQLVAKHKEEMQNSTEIVELLKDTDTSKSGTISLNRFQQYMVIPRFRDFFEFRDLEIKDATMFFSLLSAVSETDDIPYDTFAQGCLRMKGHASVLDVQSLRIELKTTYLQQAKLFKQLSKELSSITDQLEKFKEDHMDLRSLESHEESAIRDQLRRKELSSFTDQLAQREDIKDMPGVVPNEDDFKLGRRSASEAKDRLVPAAADLEGKSATSSWRRSASEAKDRLGPAAADLEGKSATFGC